jgi:hypothetical protein
MKTMYMIMPGPTSVSRFLTFADSLTEGPPGLRALDRVRRVSIVLARQCWRFWSSYLVRGSRSLGRDPRTRERNVKISFNEILPKMCETNMLVSLPN